MAVSLPERGTDQLTLLVSEGSCDSIQGTVPPAEIGVESWQLFAEEFVWHDGSWNGPKNGEGFIPMGIPTFRSFILRG